MFFKDAICLFIILKTLKTFLENYWFSRKSENDVIVGGGERGVMFFASLSRNVYEYR